MTSFYDLCVHNVLYGTFLHIENLTVHHEVIRHWMCIGHGCVLALHFNANVASFFACLVQL